MTAKRYVMIVEDCEETIPALQMAIETFHGCEVRHSLDALACMAWLEAEGALPLAVITDLNMPGTSGYELIAKLRANPGWKGMPIIVISADTHPGTPGRVRELGADAFFLKPYSPAAVCQSLERILHAKTQLAGSDCLTVPGARPERGGPECGDIGETRPSGETK